MAGPVSAGTPEFRLCLIATQPRTRPQTLSCRCGIHLLMEPAQELLQGTTVTAGGRAYQLTLYREDLSALYPGMTRYVLEAVAPGGERARYITNTFEYSPLLPGSAESAAREMMAGWEDDLHNGPDRIFSGYPARTCTTLPGPPLDLLVLQGSPRPDGNSAIIASWAVAAAEAVGKNTEVIYPHDLAIHPCIGCYQCYNTGTCVFDDDMNEIIAAVRAASVIIVCSPVYSNTVPAGLKLVIDRMQAYHAERALFGGRTDQHGLIFSVAGREGKENFTCITRVLHAFFHTLGVPPSGEMLIDRADTIKDIRTLPGKEADVTAMVKRLLFA